MSSAESEVMPSCWAGGEHVCIPRLGVGRIIGEDPRVIEIPLPAPECAVFLVDGSRAVVLVDPRVPSARRLHAIAMARHLEESTGIDEPTELAAVAGDDATPPGGMPIVATHPALRVVRSDPRG